MNIEIISEQEKKTKGMSDVDKKTAPKNNKWDRWDVRIPDEEDQLKAYKLFVKSGCQSKSEFMRKQILNEKFTVRTVDKNLLEYVAILKQILFELNKIGINYNQITRKINSTHSIKVGVTLLEKVERSHQEILELLSYVKVLSDQLKEKLK